MSPINRVRIAALSYLLGFIPVAVLGGRVLPGAVVFVLYMAGWYLLAFVIGRIRCRHCGATTREANPFNPLWSSHCGACEAPRD